MKILALIVLGLTVTSCVVSPRQDYSAAQTSPDIQQATDMTGPGWPAGLNELRTTEGDIFLDNLNSQIITLQQNPALTRLPRYRVMLAGLLYQRFQIEGRLADAEQSLLVMREAEELTGFSADDRLVYATVLQGFHDFDQASKQISRAAGEGADGASVDRAMASLERSRNLAEDLGPVDPASIENYLTAVQMAALNVNQGRLTDATVLLRRAQALYGDSSPYPLAWIHVQQGIAFLRFNQYEQARIFFSAAHERMPQFFLATEHLAETESLLGNHRRAAELYRQVTRQNDQPAFWHGLAEAELALGNTEAAGEAARQAAEGYSRLLQQHPLMYADHAVDYYLDTDNAAKALELAQLNFRHRQDLFARLALAEALAAMGQIQAACEQVGDVRQAGLSPPEISQSSGVLASCNP